MRHVDEKKPGRAPGPSDAAIWRQCRRTDAIDDEAERLLDLAAFADSRLDSDDHERIAALIGADPAAAADVAAARAVRPQDTSVSPRIIARAIALVEDAAPTDAPVIAFALAGRTPLAFRGIAQWGSLAAAIAIASWLGFALGSDASTAYGQLSRASEDGFLSELLDPSTGILRSLTEGLET